MPIERQVHALYKVRWRVSLRSGSSWHDLRSCSSWHDGKCQTNNRDLHEPHPESRRSQPTVRKSCPAGAALEPTRDSFTSTVSTLRAASRFLHCESHCEKLVKNMFPNGALRATAQSAKGVARGGGRTALHLEKTNGRRRPAAEPPPPLPPAPAPANDVLTPSDGRKRCSIQGRVLSDT